MTDVNVLGLTNIDVKRIDGRGTNNKGDSVCHYTYSWLFI